MWECFARLRGIFRPQQLRTAPLGILRAYPSGRDEAHRACGAYRTYGAHRTYRTHWTYGTHRRAYRTHWAHRAYRTHRTYGAHRTRRARYDQ